MTKLFRQESWVHMWLRQLVGLPPRLTWAPGWATIKFMEGNEEYKPLTLDEIKKRQVKP